MENIGKRNRNIRKRSFAATVTVIAAIGCVSAMATHVWAHSAATEQVPADKASVSHATNQAESGASAAAEKPAFEVASIKRDTSNTNMVRMGGSDVTKGPDLSRFSAANVTAKMLIGFAYDMRDFQISGGPSWIGAERFDVDAKVDDDLAQQLRKLPRDHQLDQERLMMQSLLADRFQLRVTRATKELPVFALLVAKGGPKLTEAAPITSVSAADNPPVAPPPRERWFAKMVLPIPRPAL